MSDRLDRDKAQLDADLRRIFAELRKKEKESRGENNVIDLSHTFIERRLERTSSEKFRELSQAAEEIERAFETKEYEKVIAYAQIFLENEDVLNPQPKIYFLLGWALCRTGRLAEARAVCFKAISLFGQKSSFFIIIGNTFFTMRSLPDMQMAKIYFGRATDQAKLENNLRNSFTATIFLRILAERIETALLSLGLL